MSARRETTRQRRAGQGRDGIEPLGEVYLEHQRIGSVVKVSAIHAGSGVEVSIMGPASASQKELELTAINKLKYVMAKKAR